MRCTLLVFRFCVRREYVRKTNHGDKEENPQRNELRDTAEEGTLEAEYEEIDMDDLARNPDTPAVASIKTNVQTGTRDGHVYTYVTCGHGSVSINDTNMEKNKPTNKDDMVMVGKQNVTNDGGSASTNYFVLEKNKPKNTDEIEMVEIKHFKNAVGNASENYFILEKNELPIEDYTTAGNDVDAYSRQHHMFDRTVGANPNEPYDVIGKMNKIVFDQQQTPYDTIKNVGQTDNTYDTTQVRNVAVKDRKDNSNYNRVEIACNKNSSRDAGPKGINFGDNLDLVKTA